MSSTRSAVNAVSMNTMPDRWASDSNQWKREDRNGVSAVVEPLQARIATAVAENLKIAIIVFCAFFVIFAIFHQVFTTSDPDHCRALEGHVGPSI